MNALINFYKELDMINLIIFWGIVIVIILIIILIIIMLCKKKNNKKTKIEQNYNEEYEEELPIKKIEDAPSVNEEKTAVYETIEHDNSNIFNNEPISEPIKESFVQIEEPEVLQNIEQEEFIVEAKEPEIKTEKKPFEMPTAPYQRNVLREMSLSQTSPIGINRKDRLEEKQTEMVKDLSNSLNQELTEDIDPISNYEINNHNIELEQNIEENEEIIKEEPLIEIKQEVPSRQSTSNIQYVPNIQSSLPQELLDIDTKIRKEKSLSEKYLEEVSQKLSETENIDEIERTNYELQQEEDAIISYKELMEKKDSIQTIDEEDAVISIEELMNRENNKTQEKAEDTKMYNLDAEENDDFINELKQFRNDLK